ncbi:MAG TPA: hypothetical protein VGH02_03980 [Rhizomicrobium sp.]|jgi:hypothetical protein
MSSAENITPAPQPPPLDFVSLCVRVPKSGSESLSKLLREAFASRRTFYLPSTIKLDGSISAFQNFRFRRTRSRNLMRQYGTPSIDAVFARIAAQATAGDLIDGGHIDFPTVRAQVQPLRMITILRHPVDRVSSEYRYARAGHLRKNIVSRLDAALNAKMAARHDFDGYLDFLLDHGETYGSIASRCIGWDGAEDLRAYFSQNVFHSGVLEESARYTRSLGEKLGLDLSFPYTNRSTKSGSVSPTASQRARIERLHARDMQLYEWQRANL